jgi:hypothetical protein
MGFSHLQYLLINWLRFLTDITISFDLKISKKWRWSPGREMKKYQKIAGLCGTKAKISESDQK